MVFPARAGMSPENPPMTEHEYRVPRASGDEPGGVGLVIAGFLCSPRERG